jgi:DNA polymerase I-like protein with 3'-5' exonuclease and polymerase domains
VMRQGSKPKPTRNATTKIGNSVALLTIDFETYYTSKDLGFRTQTTEEYIRDSRFEVIGVAVQVDAGEPVWFSGDREATRKWLKQFDWKNSMMLAHNTLFDGAILKWHFGITPMVYLDTLCMARAIHGVEVGGSLAKLALRYGIGEKGTEVTAAIDKTRSDFTPEDLAQYGEYCRNDVTLTYQLFNNMSKGFPMEELKLIDMTLRMFTHPMLYVDEETLQQRLDDLRKEQSELLSSLMEKLECATEEEVRKQLSSNQKFAKVLEGFGVVVPLKNSPTTGKEVPALAKKDEGFIALTENEDTFIQHLCAVRLGTKSTLEEKRIQRFIDIGKRNRGMIPVPLKYYGAHTGRWSGSDKINFQNLPSRDVKKKALKKGIIPPEGYLVINSDSSQIEARVLAWLAGQDDVVKQFADGEDVYSVFASSIYERPISKKDPTERFVGKTCILGLGYGTGALKLQHTLSTSQPVSVKLDEDECKRIVGVYREKNDKIIDLWHEADQLLEDMMNNKFDKPLSFGQHGCVFYDAEGIILPNNLRIRYPNLRRAEKDGKSQIVYDSRRGEISIWGGGVVENIVQALARIIVGTQMVEINDKYRVALTVHDAAVVVVEEDKVDIALEVITGLMFKPPTWASGLPVACEAKAGATYGDC